MCVMIIEELLKLQKNGLINYGIRIGNIKHSLLTNLEISTILAKSISTLWRYISSSLKFEILTIGYHVSLAF